MIYVSWKHTKTNKAELATASLPLLGTAVFTRGITDCLNYSYRLKRKFLSVILSDFWEFISSEMPFLAVYEKNR